MDMTTDNEVLIWIGAAAAGAFMLGRWTAPAGTVINVAPSVDGDDLSSLGPVGGGAPPLPPPATLPDEPLGDGEAGRFADRWDDVAWDVEVYPEAADATRISPPLGPAVASTAADCSIVAIPVGWWDRAGDVAEDLAEIFGPEQGDIIVSKILGQLAPDCADADTTATRELRREIEARLGLIIPGIQFPPPVPLPVMNPAPPRRVRPAPRATKAIASTSRRRRTGRSRSLRR